MRTPEYGTVRVDFLVVPVCRLGATIASPCHGNWYSAERLPGTRHGSFADDPTGKACQLERPAATGGECTRLVNCNLRNLTPPAAPHDSAIQSRTRRDSGHHRQPPGR